MLGIIKEQEQNKNNNPQVQYILNMFISFIFITGFIWLAQSIINPLNYLIYKSLQKQQKHHSRKKFQI